MTPAQLALTALALSLTLGMAPARSEDGTPPPAPKTDTAQPKLEPTAPRGITWFGTWDRALAEAKRTGRPILFTSAAPACGNVPGMW